MRTLTAAEISQKLIGIGENLETLHNELAQKLIDRESSAGIVDALKLSLLPLGGWVGSNDATRNAERDKAYAESSDLQKSMSYLRLLDDDILLKRGQIAGYEARRRGLEWGARILIETFPIDDEDTLPF